MHQRFYSHKSAIKRLIWTIVRNLVQSSTFGMITLSPGIRTLTKLSSTFCKKWKISTLLNLQGEWVMFTEENILLDLQPPGPSSTTCGWSNPRRRSLWCGRRAGSGLRPSGRPSPWRGAWGQRARSCWPIRAEYANMLTNHRSRPQWSTAPGWRGRVTPPTPRWWQRETTLRWAKLSSKFLSPFICINSMQIFTVIHYITTLHAFICR